ncbi:MAG: hypothetical protein CMJ78_25440 [Planctomycetaceae bacterium]|nr:hypothetical protein [Planctomycetaceae bacterium]
MGTLFLPATNSSSVTGQVSAAKPSDSRDPVEVGHPTFMSPHAAPIAVSNGRVFVVNTPSDTVDVIDAKSRKVTARVNVGIDPVSIAVRPDGKEVWVSNHVSDSVSVIDADSSSATFLHVIATLQEFNAETKATRFDEPVGIAFASNDKAYVALSSENQIAVVDVASRKVTKRLRITAQDPRAIVVRNDRLYVIPFESNNKTQLSGGTGKIDGELVTFNAFEHSIRVNNVLSLGHVTDIVKHPKVPDRDLYVFDTKTDKLVEVVDTLGTLLYGLAVNSKGRVYVAQTDARNDANGRSGTKKHGLKELENRAFLNQITSVDFKGDEANKPEFFNLEPLPPKQPNRQDALATPFGIQVSDDDKTLVVSAAGSDKLFTIDANSGKVLGRTDVGAVPRGIALDSHNAWVFNAVENSVSLVDLSDRWAPQSVETIALADPTHAEVKRGRIAFNTASASTTGTFSCASCHPDGHTDQLLWVLATPIVTGGNQIMPRSTMPIRGLRDTEPYHWDGIPGDPYGGNNSANIHGSDPPNSKVDVPTTSTRHLIDGGLANTMALVGDSTKNDEGKAGFLSAAERDDMATFLLSVPYPPAQRRAYDNVVSDRARSGFKLFHIDGDLDGKVRPNVCGNCHRMPFLVSTNTPGTGMDAPTWRGAYDRFLILPQGRLNIIDFDFYARVAEQGQPERSIWQFSWAGRRRFDPVWNMVLEGSTGYSGSFARQLTLNKTSAVDDLTDDILGALEISAAEGAVILEGDGAFIDGGKSTSVVLQFDGKSYIRKDNGSKLTRKELVQLAATGKFVGTFSGKHGFNDDVESPQPGLWTLGPIQQQRGRQDFPILFTGNHKMTISGRHVEESANIFIDGRKVDGQLTVEPGDKLTIELASLPSQGMHLLQVQNPYGLFSNDFIFHVVENQQAAADYKQTVDQQHLDVREKSARAIAAGDLDQLKRLLGRRAERVNARHPGNGSTLMSTAAFHGNLEIFKYLISRGGKITATNRDGNTPLHVAAFMCRTDIVKYLLEKGASPTVKNTRNETPVSVVSSPVDKELADIYQFLARVSNIKIDLDRIKKTRPEVAKLLKESSEDK